MKLHDKNFLPEEYDGDFELEDSAIPDRAVHIRTNEKEFIQCPRCKKVIGEHYGGKAKAAHNCRYCGNWIYL